MLVDKARSQFVGLSLTIHEGILIELVLPYFKEEDSLDVMAGECE